MICLVGAGASSSAMQLVPRSSRSVRSSTTEKRVRSARVSVRTRSSTLAMPAASSCGAMRWPMPQPSPTGVAANTPTDDGEYPDRWWR